jgi:hypothetical protein
MKRLSLLIALLFSIPALGQSTPSVTAITPSSAPSTGGTEITITGSNLATKVQCIIPCPALVTFGDISVPVKSETSTRLVVDAPPHQPGTVDVTIAIAGETPLKLPNAFTFTPDHDDVYETVLLPVYSEGTVPGAFGSQWQTDFWMHADTQNGVQIAPWPCPPPFVCPPVFPLTSSLAYGQTLHNLAAGFKPANGNPSVLLYLSRPEVSMSLRVADTSRSTLNAGTDIPVIRENAMRSGVTQLFNVPANPNFRVLLRLYETVYTYATFTVRLYDQADLSASATPIHVMTVPVSTTQTNEFRTEAAYAEIDLSNLQLGDRVWPAAVRVEIEPQLPGSRYWAFASITNNATQLVTLSTPQ